MIRAKNGYRQGFGGAYIPEILQATFQELNAAFNAARADPAFWAEYAALMGSYSCRPAPPYLRREPDPALRGARIFIKREDLNHTGAH